MEVRRLRVGIRGPASVWEDQAMLGCLYTAQLTSHSRETRCIPKQSGSHIVSVG